MEHTEIKQGDALWLDGSRPVQALEAPFLKYRQGIGDWVVILDVCAAPVHVHRLTPRGAIEV
jgi:hypothetical protein